MTISKKVIKDSNGNIKSTTEYNSKGNLVYFNRPASDTEEEYTVRKEYDSNGNLTHYQDSTGREHTYTYNENGKLIGFADSNGYTESIEYVEQEESK